MIRFLFLWTGCCLCSAAPLFAAPTLTSLFPAGVQRGASTEVTASGTFDVWPVQVWASSPLIEGKAEKDKGKIRISVKPETPPDIYWLRLADATGASSVRPFLVGIHPDVAEVEPNDDPTKAQPLKGPSSIHGKLVKSGDVDCYAVTAKKGETIVASLDAHTTLRSPIDAVLQVATLEGAVVAENHDYRKLDPQVTYTVPSDGTYVVRVFAFPAMPDSSIRHFGSELSVYRLTISTGPWVDYATPLAMRADQETNLTLHGWNLKEKTFPLLKNAAQPVIPNMNLPVPIRREPHDCFDFTRDQPTKELTAPFTVTGRLNEPESVFTFKAVKARPMTMKLESASLGFSLNPVVVVQGPDGKQVAKLDPPQLNVDAEANVNPPVDGVYRVVVRDLGRGSGPRFAYRLRMLVDESSLEATVASDRFTMMPDKPLDIPITLTRKRFADPVEVSVIGLDKDTTAKVVPPAGKDDGKTVTVRLETKSASFSGPIRIVLNGKPESKMSVMAQAAVTEFDTKTPDLWLTISGKK